MFTRFDVTAYNLLSNKIFVKVRIILIHAHEFPLREVSSSQITGVSCDNIVAFVCVYIYIQNFKMITVSKRII